MKDQIVILSRKEELLQTTNSCLFFIEQLGAKETNFTNSLKELSKELSKNTSAEKIKKFEEELGKFGINILNPKTEDRDYLSILAAFYSKKNSLPFIMKLTDEDCRTLQELVNETASTFLGGAEINDMIRCSNLMHNLGQIRDTKTDQELLDSFIKAVK